MFRFVFPFQDNTVFNVALGGKDLAAAFDEFRRYWWNPGIPARIGVWHNAALVAAVLPVYNEQTGENDPVMQDLAAIAPSQSNRFACGD